MTAERCALVSEYAFLSDMCLIACAYGIIYAQIKQVRVQFDIKLMIIITSFLKKGDDIFSFVPT